MGHAWGRPGGLTTSGEPCARQRAPLPAETRLVSTFPAARPLGLTRARPHSGSRGGRRRGRGLVSPGGGLRSAPPLPLSLSVLPPVPLLLARATSPAPPPQDAGNPGDVTTQQPSPSRAHQKRREEKVTCREGASAAAQKASATERPTAPPGGRRAIIPDGRGRAGENVTDVISRRRGATAA